MNYCPSSLSDTFISKSGLVLSIANCEYATVQTSAQVPFLSPGKIRGATARILDKIRRSDLGQIFNLTKCLKPCSYKKYSLLGDRKPSHFKSKYVAFSLWASSEKTRVVTEQLIYPLSSLIAEFGGTLSLFLGVSFVTIWDNFRLFGMLYRIGFKK